MPKITSLIAAHKRGDKGSLNALAVALAASIHDPAPLPVDPVEHRIAAEERGTVPGTWEEVRAARDYGDITPAEYDYLAASVEALTQEDPDGRQH